MPYIMCSILVAFCCQLSPFQSANGSTSGEARNPQPTGTGPDPDRTARDWSWSRLEGGGRRFQLVMQVEVAMLRRSRVTTGKFYAIMHGDMYDVVVSE